MHGKVNQSQGGSMNLSGIHHHCELIETLLHIFKYACYNKFVTMRETKPIVDVMDPICNRSQLGLEPSNGLLGV